MQDAFTLSPTFFRSPGLNRYRGIGFADSRSRAQPYLIAEYYGLVKDLVDIQKEGSKQAATYARDAYKEASRENRDVQGTRAVRTTESPLTIMMAGEDPAAPLGYSTLPSAEEIDYSPIGYGPTSFAGRGVRAEAMPIPVAKKRVAPRKKRAPVKKRGVYGAGWYM